MALSTRLWVGLGHAGRWYTAEQFTEYAEWLYSVGVTGVMIPGGTIYESPTGSHATNHGGKAVVPVGPATAGSPTRTNLTCVDNATGANFTLNATWWNFVREIIDRAGAAGLEVGVQIFGKGVIGDNNDGALTTANDTAFGTDLENYIGSSTDIKYIVTSRDDSRPVASTQEDTIWGAVRTAYEAAGGAVVEWTHHPGAGNSSNTAGRLSGSSWLDFHYVQPGHSPRSTTWWEDLITNVGGSKPIAIGEMNYANLGLAGTPGDNWPYPPPTVAELRQDIITARDALGARLDDATGYAVALYVDWLVCTWCAPEEGLKPDGNLYDSYWDGVKTTMWPSGHPNTSFGGVTNTIGSDGLMVWGQELGVQPPGQGGGGTIALSAGDNIQVKGINVAQQGDTITLAAGNYFSQSLYVDKDQLTIESASGTQSDVKIYGGPQVTGFAASGSYWKASTGLSISQEFSHPEQNGAGYQNGMDTLMVTVDLAYYHPVGSAGNLGDDVPLGATGNFFYDYGTQELWLSDDPGAGIVVVSTEAGAVYGPGNDLTFKNVTVSTYKNGAQIGAVGGGPSNVQGTSWDIDNVRITACHGVGMKSLGDNATLQNSTINYCGQLGVGCSPANGQPQGPNLREFTVHNNLIEYNNMKGYSPGWEAGATKFAWVDKAVITHNEVRYNKGFGLWCDINVYDTDYRWNHVYDNWGDGIKHEISWTARIRENHLTGNGLWPGAGNWPPEGDSGWGSMPGIAVHESNGVYSRPNNVAPYGIIVENNLVTGNKGGILAAARQNRDGSDPGDTNWWSWPGGDAYHLKGVTVRNNDVNWTSGSHGVGDNDGNAATNPCAETGTSAVTFTNNDYTVNGSLSIPGSGWEFCGGTTYTGWQTLGNDAANAGAVFTESPGRVTNVTDDQDVHLGLIDQASTVHSLAVVQGSGNMVLPLIDNTAVIHAMQVSALITRKQRINAGGPEAAQVTDTVAWEADDTGHAYNDDTVGTFTVSNWTGAVDLTSDPSMPVPPPVETIFRTERYDTLPDSMSYTFPGLDPSLRYSVLVYAMENWPGITAAGQRVFSVFANGVTVAADWDVFAESSALTNTGEFTTEFTTEFEIVGSVGVGLHVGLVKSAQVWPTAGGDITITTTSTGAQNPFLNGIELALLDQSVTLTLIDQTPVLHPLSVATVATTALFLPLIDQTAVIHDLSYVTTPTQLPPIQLPTIDQTATIHTVTVSASGGTTVASSVLQGPFWFDVIDTEDTDTGSSSASVARSSSFLIGENDTLPALTGYIRNGPNDILDLSSSGINPSTITFSMKNITDGRIQVDEQTCTWDTSTHIVTYTWAAADTDTTGEYDGEVEVTTASGKFTAPASQPKIRITVGGEIS